MRKLTHNLKIKAKKRMKNCGFTMVELIVVVAILGVLAAILIPTLLGITIRATVGSANTTASELKKQIGYFLTMADANRKNYMLMGEDCREVFTISVVDGTWYIDAAQTSIFSRHSDMGKCRNSNAGDQYCQFSVRRRTSRNVSA